MCGIFCSLSTRRHVLPSAEIHALLRRRGPDSTNTICLRHPVSNATTPDGAAEHKEVNLTFTSTVLSLRGATTVSQPYNDQENESVLCWNGEAWSIGNMRPTGNDTQAIFDLLVHEDGTDETDSGVPTRGPALRLAAVAGPAAFVFYHSRTSRLYFGRDFLGRRSLLWRLTDDGDLLLSSVGPGNAEGHWAEIEADGTYCIDLKETGCRITTGTLCEKRGNFTVRRMPYRFVGDANPDGAASVIPRLSLNKTLSTAPVPPLSASSPVVGSLEEILRKALALRILGIPNHPHLHAQRSGFPPSKLAILFSGGLDCTVLARIVHDLLPFPEPIDLLNVAFENPRVHKIGDSAHSAAISAYERCPDRVTGRASIAELQRVCPGREWRFVAINIPYNETLEHREMVVKLMHPHNTEMDLSIAYAFYFASRGKGQTSSTNAGELKKYETAARVLLSGLGADELFAGYTRHATAFTRNGHAGLLDELDLDIGRLGKRNLGRDDRVISTWGREARFPFLDESLVMRMLEAPLNDKCGFGEPAVYGDPVESDASARLEPGKKLLRCLAWKLGMTGVAAEKKRAIQFGARTAKMNTGKTKGTFLVS